MASYAMAHLKIDLLLKETGYTPKTNQRLRVFLTNSLEEPHSEVDTLFSNWLTTEAYEANKIKNETPVMCVIGNPPYAVSSNNKGEWIEKLLIDYKKDLNEKSYNSLSDDYVKFIRYGQHFIDRNGSGILAYISNNSFVDGIVFRQMRKSLLNSFDKIYILDLHGNSKKKEVSPDGTSDQNVFDIMQGVSINILVKTCNKKKDSIGEVHHFDLYGSRSEKYSFLEQKKVENTDWTVLDLFKPEYYFVNKNYSDSDNYLTGFKIDDIFKVYGPGVETGLDKLFVSNDKQDLISTFSELSSKSEEAFKKFNIENKSSFKIKNKLLETDFESINNSIVTYQYKVFDFKYLVYLKDILRRADYNVFKHIGSENYYLTMMRKCVDTNSFKSILVSKHIIDKNLYSFQSYSFPLYTKLATEQYTLNDKSVRTPNLSPTFINKLCESLGLTFSDEKNNNYSTFAPIDILDYIYAVLHSPTYREKYKEFLKIDFPRVPYPKDSSTFWSLVEKGGAIRALHLLESPLLDTFITTYPESGTNQVGKVRYDNGKVYINETQYFDKVPQIAWEFYIGGYQPAQKWLKDRKDRVLTFEDILHYQKVIIALNETDRLMKEIDGLGIEW
jgi:predicted helicase